jgi:oligopeptidase B
MLTQETRLLKQQVVLDSDFKPENYISKRIWANSHDGVKVPISLVYRKMENKEHRKTILYGYGSYGYSLDVCFNSTRLSLLDRGFIFAIAHVRGGEEMGRYWYEDGKFLKKKNSFLDFIACAEMLVAEGYTLPSQLCALGGSAGGMLVTAVANMRPNLFRAVVAEVPFVDVLTTMLDEDLPLTVGEYDEWGNPNEKDYFDYMLSYSPYDNIKAQHYPAMLVTAAYHDSQVQYWEAAKYVAKLRATKTDNNVLLLKTEMSAGHSGASGRYQSIRELAFVYAFLIAEING